MFHINFGLWLKGTVYRGCLLHMDKLDGHSATCQKLPVMIEAKSQYRRPCWCAGDVCVQKMTKVCQTRSSGQPCMYLSSNLD